MTYRKTLTVFYRILALVAIVAVAALLWPALSFVRGTAHAEESQPQA